MLAYDELTTYHSTSLPVYYFPSAVSAEFKFYPTFNGQISNRIDLDLALILITFLVRKVLTLQIFSLHRTKFPSHAQTPMLLWIETP